MSKGLNIGDTGNIARKIKKLYIGDTSNIARKIKKAWIGDMSNVARLMYSGSRLLSYYGKTTQTLSSTRVYHGAATVGKYAIFFGGSSSASTADVYDDSLTRLSPLSITSSSSSVQGLYFNNQAVFKTASHGWIQAIDASLTVTKPCNITPKRSSSGYAANDSYIVMPAAYDTATSHITNCAFIDTSFTYTTQTTSLGNDLGITPGSGTFNSCAVFSGGDNKFADKYLTNVYMYDNSLTLTVVGNLSAAKIKSAVETAGDRLIIHGGRKKSVDSNGDTVSLPNASADAYDSSYTRTKLSSIHPGLDDNIQLISVHIDDYAVFIGGILDRSGTPTDVVSIYDNSLVQTTLVLSQTIRGHAATVVGNYILSAGGSPSGNAGTTAVEVIQAI